MVGEGFAIEWGCLVILGSHLSQGKIGILWGRG